VEVVILAGGAGLRLRPITYWTPKPLFPVPGGTFLSRLLQQIAPLNPRAIHVVTHHLADQIAEMVAQHPNVHVLQQSPPFTLPGALASAARVVKEPCLVLHADNYFSALPLDAIRTAPDTGCTFLLETLPDIPVSSHATVSTGCYLLNRAALQESTILSAEDTLATLVAKLQKSGHEVRFAPLGGWRYDINTVQDYLALQRQLWADPSTRPAQNGDGPSVWVAPSTTVADAVLGPHVTVGRHAHLRDCTLAESVVLAGSRVEGVRLQNVLAGPGPEGCSVLMFSGEVPAPTPANAAQNGVYR